MIGWLVAATARRRNQDPVELEPIAIQDNRSTFPPPIVPGWTDTDRPAVELAPIDAHCPGCGRRALWHWTRDVTDGRDGTSYTIECAHCDQEAA